MIFCVSDWHIDNGRNKFSTQYQMAHLFLDLVGDKPLYLIGDTLELWANEWFEIYGGPYRDLLTRIAERKGETVVFAGNHDIEEELLHKFFPKAQIRTRMTVGDRRIFHGFQIDPLLDSAEERWLASSFDRAFTMIDIPWLNALREGIADKARSNVPLFDALWQYQEYKRFLLGHSHVEEDQGWFVNCGSPLFGKFPYVELEKNGDASLKYF
jgi:UDP-2,3-diacylglucosamine pyrophosphatase LpxH